MVEHKKHFPTDISYGMVATSITSIRATSFREVALVTPIVAILPGQLPTIHLSLRLTDRLLYQHPSHHLSRVIKLQSWLQKSKDCESRMLSFPPLFVALKYNKTFFTTTPASSQTLTLHCKSTYPPEYFKAYAKFCTEYRRPKFNYRQSLPLEQLNLMYKSSSFELIAKKNKPALSDWSKWQLFKTKLLCLLIGQSRNRSKLCLIELET
jgi:hypothetical protein